MTGDGIIIRSAVPADARGIAALANEFNALDGHSDDLYSEDLIQAQVFCDTPLVSVLVADHVGELAGYAFFHDCYNSEKAAPGVWLVDLYVREAARRKGLGQRLFAAVARATVERGAKSVWWGVRNQNRAARAFYGNLGAKDDEARILELTARSCLAWPKLRHATPTAGPVVDGDGPMTEEI